MGSQGDRELLREKSKSPPSRKEREKGGAPLFLIDNGLIILYIQFILKETLWRN